ncbi:pentatricopeptide repeat-containing protein [Quercus suber]|uniref:Pentatricopeptide repeat-containing protein n=1 Tax=Quercus suber TaxID=58331 RepID=A0AAW0ME66_QUESU
MDSRHFSLIVYTTWCLGMASSPIGSISSVLPTIGNLEDLVLGIQIHGYVTKQGFDSDKRLVTALIDMYGKCACTLEMSQVFHEINEMDIGACNVFITGLSRNGQVNDALEWRYSGNSKAKGWN